MGYCFLTSKTIGYTFMILSVALSLITGITWGITVSIGSGLNYDEKDGLSNYGMAFGFPALLWSTSMVWLCLVSCDRDDNKNVWGKPRTYRAGVKIIGVFHMASNTVLFGYMAYFADKLMKDYPGLDIIGALVLCVVSSLLNSILLLSFLGMLDCLNRFSLCDCAFVSIEEENKEKIPKSKYVYAMPRSNY